MEKIAIEIPFFDKIIMEADDENEGTNVKVVPRSNRGTDYNNDRDSVRVAPRSNRGTDYNNDENDSNEDSSNDNSSSASDDADDEPTNYNDDSDNGSSNNSDNSDNDNNDTSDESSNDDADDEPTNYNDDSENDSSNNSDDNNSDNSDSSNDNEDGATKDKRYYTYRRFLYLYNSIDSFIERLRNIVKSDPIENRVIQIVIDNLTNIHDNMFDYMISKFKKASYVQILVYFETIISIVQLNFELLRNNRINLKQ